MFYYTIGENRQTWVTSGGLMSILVKTKTPKFTCFSDSLAPPNTKKVILIKNKKKGSLINKRDLEKKKEKII